jgi:hypothetical protein
MLFIVVSTLAVAQNSVRVYKELKHDTSLPLSQLINMTPAQPNPFSPRVLDILPTGHDAPLNYTQAPDAAIQDQVLPPVAASVGLNFEGLGLGFAGFGICCAPPDTNGNVGATQYVQWVNLSFAVFNKTTGAVVAGPTAGNALWAGFGGQCQTANSGDPIVQYDKIANRWVLTQFAVNASPFLQCVAVSTTSDATGSYNRYAFSFANQFNDYPKMGVWPDAYYISFNNFLNGQSFTGPNACAMDRAKMLIGAAATIQCFQQASSFSTLLPSDMDGTIQPSAGEPGFFVDFGLNKLNLWKFHVDFATPANSTFTGPTALAVAAFTQGCNRTCVAQPGTTNRLDMLGDRMMYRLAWRKFADGHEALVTSHTITTGYRWYEVRDPNGTPTVFQQGTFAPDASTRWMGSIAMDQNGNMAMGYTLGSATIFPSVFFTGRVPSDPAGTMETEQVIVNGAGSQTSPTRWGDYSAMTVDPVDDCTFWYTQEYSNVTGSFSWNTRIANLKFTGCSSGPSFGLTANPNTLSIARGSSKTSTITVSPFNGFSGNVTLAASGLPSGVTAGFAPNPTATTSTLTLTASAGATIGPATVTITGTSGALTATTSINLTITGNGPTVTVTPTSLHWAKFFVGVTSGAKTVTVTNTGSSTLNISSIVTTGDFLQKIVARSCKPTLAAGASCVIKVQFQPTQLGLRTGDLAITDDAPDSPQHVSLSGTGK